MKFHSANPLRLKILPVTRCSVEIKSQNHANPKIPEHREGGGVTPWGDTLRRAMARLPGQCMHIMVDGAHCGSPAMRRARFCYYHKRQRKQRIALTAERARDSHTLPFTLPVLEDADSIQLSLTQIMRLLAAGEIAHETAGLLFYALQIATANLQQTTLDKSPCALVPE